ncbi:MAG: hypothetical protein AB7O84_23885, partial [Planctomycetota bacterium]
LFRQLTPLVLLGIALAALFGPLLPGAAWVAQHLGATFFLGFCVFLLSLYVLLLWGESLRQHALMTSLLKELMEFRNRRAGEVQGRPLAQKLDAVRLLLPALASGDEKVRSTSRRNLSLLVGQDLGDDVAAWQRWLDQHDGA